MSESAALDRVAKAELGPRMQVGTFLKTGTMLMLAVIRQIANALNYKCWMPASGDEPPEDWNVILALNSRFRKSLMDLGHPTAIVIRDPRDVIISGAYYHSKTVTPGDPRLHVPDDRFGGPTYQQKLASLPDDGSRFVFEVDHKGAGTLRNMLRFILHRAKYFWRASRNW